MHTFGYPSGNGSLRRGSKRDAIALHLSCFHTSPSVASHLASRVRCCCGLIRAYGQKGHTGITTGRRRTPPRLPPEKRPLALVSILDRCHVLYKSGKSPSVVPLRLGQFLCLWHVSRL